MKKDLRHMGRRDLLRILLEVQRENETLRQENDTLREQLECRRVQMQELGSIAEVAMRLHRVFEDAQAAADQYVENERAMYAPDEPESEPEDAGEEDSDGGE